MKLSDHLRDLDDVQRAALADDAGTTPGHLRNVAFSGKPCGIHLAVGLERATLCAVRRWDLRPDDWHLIWPELVGADGAPPPGAQEEPPEFCGSQHGDLAGLDDSGPVTQCAEVRDAA